MKASRPRGGRVDLCVAWPARRTAPVEAARLPRLSLARPCPRRPGCTSQRLPYRKGSSCCFQVSLAVVKVLPFHSLHIAYSYRRRPLLFIKGCLTLRMIMKDASFIHFFTRGLSRMREDAGPLQALVTDIYFRARDSAAGSRCGVESRWGLDDHAARTCCPGRVPAPLGALPAALPRTRVDGRRVGGTRGVGEPPVSLLCASSLRRPRRRRRLPVNSPKAAT